MSSSSAASSSPGVKFWDLEEAEVEHLPHSPPHPPPPAHSPRQTTDAESWYGDDEEDFGFETLGGQHHQPARRQKRKRWGCAGSRTAVGGGLRREEDAPPLSGHQREAVEGPRAAGRGCEHVARSSERGEGMEEGGLRRSEEFVYSSNWESDSSALEEEREE